MNTNKIDLIKAEVERLKSQLLRCACSSQIAMETYCKEEAYNEVLSMLDTLQEEPVSDECIYNRTLEERQRSCKFCSAACQVRIKEEPVSDDLEEEIDNYVKRNGYDGLDSIEEIKYIANHFANWQKQQDQETIKLAEDHAMLAGMEKMKEQMMKDAVEATVTEIRTYKHENEVDFTIMLDKGIIPYETEEELKLIIIKED